MGWGQAERLLGWPQLACVNMGMGLFPSMIDELKLQWWGKGGYNLSISGRERQTNKAQHGIIF